MPHDPIDELVERLHNHAEWERGCGNTNGTADSMTEAADALVALRARVDELSATLDYNAGLRRDLSARVGELEVAVQDTNDWLCRSGLEGTAHQRRLEALTHKPADAELSTNGGKSPEDTK